MAVGTQLSGTMVLMVGMGAVMAMVMPVSGKSRRGKHCDQQGSGKNSLHGFDFSTAGKSPDGLDCRAAPIQTLFERNLCRVRTAMVRTPGTGMDLLQARCRSDCGDSDGFARHHEFYAAIALASARVVVRCYGRRVAEAAGAH